MSRRTRTIPSGKIGLAFLSLISILIYFYPVVQLVVLGSSNSFTSSSDLNGVTIALEAPWYPEKLLYPSFMFDEHDEVDADTTFIKLNYWVPWEQKDFIRVSHSTIAESNSEEMAENLGVGPWGQVYRITNNNAVTFTYFPKYGIKMFSNLPDIRDTIFLIRRTDGEEALGLIFQGFI